MRKVIIEFNDGTSQNFDTMEAAAKAIGCVAPSLHRIAQGLATRLQAKHHIKSVVLELPHGKPKGMRKHGGGAHPVLCENEKTGESFVCGSLQEAKAKCHFEHTISIFADTGAFHYGWKFTSVDKPEKPIEFPTPISKEVIDLLYKYATIYAYNRCLLRTDLAEDAIQEIVNAVASDVSKGKYEQYKHKDTMKMEIWLWFRVRARGWKIVQRIREWDNAKVDCPEPEDDPKGHEANDHWLDTLSATTDADYSFLDDMPEHLRPLAECIMHGMVATEICKELGIFDKRRQELMRELRSWLREYRR
jgi:hypothetical protein